MYVLSFFSCTDKYLLIGSDNLKQNVISCIRSQKLLESSRFWNDTLKNGQNSLKNGYVEFMDEPNDKNSFRCACNISFIKS